MKTDSIGYSCYLANCCKHKCVDGEFHVHVKGIVHESPSIHLCLNFDIAVEGTAPYYICGMCGALLSANGEFMFCPVCEIEWDTSKLMTAPVYNDERYLKFREH